MLNYNAPIDGRPSTIDGDGSDQMNTFHWLKKAIIESRKEQYFMPLASVTNMPKHYGKDIKVYEYVPLLDDRNINDQGIDASGATTLPGDFLVTLPSLSVSFATESAADAAVTAVNAVEAAVATKTGTSAPYTVSFSKIRLAPTSVESRARAVAVAVAGTNVVQGSGNLYGSSRDIGTITGRIPVLTENGGRVNRVGFTRLMLQGSLHKFGFFTEFTQESLDFDSDDQLKDHLSRELLNGAVQLTEAVLQKDLLAGANTILFAGAATSDDEITGEVTPAAGGVPELPASVLSYRNLMRLDQILNDNRTPKQTKIITGSRMIDTKVIGAGRVAYIGSEMAMWLQEMTDLFGNKAFVEVQHYADAGTVLNGEIGSIGAFRFVQVPEMLHWAGAGAVVDDNPGFRSSTNAKGEERYDIFPILVVGDDSFTTIGFQTDGKTVKFNILTKMPGRETADRNHDPYGETGFSSIKWYYGILIKRPERLGLIKAVAPV